jgi:CP family cyanate transporter-like MFS transporter
VRGRLSSGSGTLLAVVLLAINFRTLFASLPPLLTEVRADFGLSASVAGLLTTGPVLCLGALGPVAPRLARRISIEWVLVLCGAVTAAGTLLRGTGSLAALFAGTMLAGAAISIGQVALPVLIRSRHAGRLGMFTGAYTMALTLGSTLSGGLAVPHEHLLGGWRGSLAFWCLPMLVALLPWLARLRGEGTFVEGPRAGLLMREPLALSVTGFFVLQSMGFYSGLTWLPTFLRDEGWSAEAAGTLQAVANGVGFVPAFLLPFFAGRMRTQGSLLVGVVGVALLGLAGLLLEPGAAALWMPVLGLAQGGALGLGLILPVLRGGDVRTVAALTGMTLSIGSFVAAAGPWLLGVARDASGGWTVPLLLLIGMSVLQFPVGLPATRDRSLVPESVSVSEVSPL